MRDPAYILGTRDYLPFSPARHVHWKASARHNRLQEKIFEPAEQDKVMLLLDVDQFSENGAYEEFERTLEGIASLAAALESQHYATAFLTNCHQQGERTNRPSVLKNSGRLSDLFERLAKLQIKPSEKMADLLSRAENLPGDATCVYFSYDYHSGKTYFQQRNIPTVHVICKNPSVEMAQSSEPDDRGGVYYLRDICITS